MPTAPTRRCFPRPPPKEPCLRPHLDIPHQLRQVEVPFLHEVGELQNEAHRVVSLLQAGQALHRPHRTEALGGRDGGGAGWIRDLTHLLLPFCWEDRS